MVSFYVALDKSVYLIKTSDKLFDETYFPEFWGYLELLRELWWYFPMKIVSWKRLFERLCLL